MAPVRFEITTRLAAPAERVWERAVSEEGINDELRPWLRMTMPRGIEPGMSVDDAPLHEPLGRSWLLLGGVVPVDFDAIRLVERGPGMRFLERSHMGTARVWQHEREVVPRGQGECEISDRLSLELRAPLAAVGGRRVAERIVRRLFSHRHRRLAEHWGTPS